MERRAHTRFPTDYTAVLTTLKDPASPVPVRVLDISEGGVSLFFELSLYHPPEAGDFVLLDIEDSTLLGEVRYREGAVAGIRVERALIGDSDLSRLIEKRLAMPLTMP